MEPASSQFLFTPGGFRLDDISEGNTQAMMVRPLVSPTVGKLRVLDGAPGEGFKTV